MQTQYALQTIKESNTMQTVKAINQFSVFPRNPRPGGKENIMLKTGLTEDHLAANGVIFNHCYTVESGNTS